MLRHRTCFQLLLIVILLISGTGFSQRKGTEVSVTKCWEFPAEDLTNIATNGRDVFAAKQGGHVFALSSKGEKLWQTDLGGDVISGLKLGGNVILVTTRGSSGGLGFNRLSVATGLPEGGTQPQDRDGEKKTSEDASAKVSIGDVVIIGNDAGLVTSLSGNGPVWKFKTGGGISAVIPFEDKFLVISRDNFVYALRSKTGGLEWKRRTQGRIGHYALGKGILFVSSLDQHGATLIDLNSGRVAGQILLALDDEVVSDPVFIGDDLILATSAGLVDYSLAACGAK